MLSVSNSLKKLLTATALVAMVQAAPFAMADDTPTDTATTEDAELSEAVGVDYSLMTQFMEKLSANERGRPAIAYNLVRDNARSVLDEYEKTLIDADFESLSGDDKLAYWLNLQNMMVVKAIANDTKKTNLKSLRGTAARPGKMWTKQRITLAGESYSIVDVEAKITAEFNDPDVMYGLYQGVKGGPCLTETPYEGETVRARLAELGGRYVNSRGIVSPKKGVVTVTPVYDWHKDALFGGDDKEIMKHVKSHAITALRGRLNTGREIKFTKLNYTVDNYVLNKPKERARTVAKRPSRAPDQSQERQQQRQQRGGGQGYGS